MSFKNKVVLITGSSSGIGASIAIKFAEEGAKVVIVGRNEKKLQDVSKKCQELGSKPLVITADVSNDEDVKRIINETIKFHNKLDVLVNNAGMTAPTNIQSPNALQVYDKIMSVNLRAVVYLTNLAVPYLVESKGNIINISSVASTKAGSSDIMNFGYCSSKAALDHFTRCIALELAPKGVRVNGVNPGPVRTDILENSGLNKAVSEKVWNDISENTPLKIISEPEEIADLVLFLASEKARSVTGSLYTIDCGYLLGLVVPKIDQ